VKLPAESSAPAPALRPAPPQLLPSTLALFMIGTAEVVAGPMMTRMGAEFGVSSARIAWFPASYALVYALLAPLLGPFSDRFGRRVLLLAGLVGLAGSMLLIALAPSFVFGLVASAAGGLWAAAVQPNALAIANDGVESSQQAEATGRVFVGLTASFVAVPMLSALLAARASWRIAYALATVGALIAAALAARLPVSGRRKPPSAVLRWRFGALLATPGVTPRLAVSFLWLGLSVGLSAILAELVRRRFQLSIQSTGVVVSTFGLVTMFGNSLTGGVSKRWKSPRVVKAGVLATACGCLVIGVLPIHSRVIAGIAGIVWALGYGIAGPFHHASLSGGDEAARVTVTAMHASLLNLGIVGVAFGAGRYFDSVGVERVTAVAVAAMAIALVLLLRLPDPQANA
jgi:predicted MFS family arabinose efflux permease